MEEGHQYYIPLTEVSKQEILDMHNGNALPAMEEYASRCVLEYAKSTPADDAVEESKGKDFNKGCNFCGGKLVMIRSRYPGSEDRPVCPTCNTERLEQIHEISSKTYGVAMQETKSTL